MTDEQEKLIDEYMAHFFPEEGVKCECNRETGVKCKFNRLTPKGFADVLSCASLRPHCP
jgi:hypothetical protein